MVLAAVGSAQTRLAGVHFTHQGPLPEKGYRVGEELYLPLHLMEHWGWSYRLEGDRARIKVGEEEVEALVRSVSGRQTIPLRIVTEKLGAITEWTAPDTLRVWATIRAVHVHDDKFLIESTLEPSAQMSVLRCPGRIVVDLSGAKLHPTALLDLVPQARVAQWKEDIVRVVLETDELPRDEMLSVIVRGKNEKDVPPPVNAGGPEKRPPPVLPLPSVGVGQLALERETDTQAHLALRLPKNPSAAPTFRRPLPDMLEILIPGDRFELPADFKLNSKHVLQAQAIPYNGGTMLQLQLARPMGAEVAASGTGVTIQLLRPSVGDGRLAGKIVVVDAGHGGHDSGARSPKKDADEKTVVLRIALALSRKLAAEGATVIMTRKDDTFVELSERAKIANRNNAHLFLSIHVNSNTKPNSTSGTIIFYHKQDAIKQLLADCIDKEIAKVSGLKSMGAWSDQRIYNSGFSVLRNTTMPGVLLELGFINHDKDRKRMLEKSYPDDMAEAIVKGIKVFLGNGKG